MLAESQPDAFTPHVAGSLNNLAGRLSDLGLIEEALAAAEEAAGLFRVLTKARPDALTPDLAMSLRTLASRLSDLGRPVDALAAAEEAADLYRVLAKARPDAFTPDLAASLNILAQPSQPGRRAGGKGRGVNAGRSKVSTTWRVGGAALPGQER
jgi:tetratricopeptide (TPR) repeat protein